MPNILGSVPQVAVDNLTLSFKCWSATPIYRTKCEHPHVAGKFLSQARPQVVPIRRPTWRPEFARMRSGRSAMGNSAKFAWAAHDTGRLDRDDL